MTRPIILPLWLFVMIVAFAAITFASHFLFPSVRWFFRKRMERVVAKLNTRLQRPIEPFKLARRHDMIQRLIYDPAVAEAIVEHARLNKIPENVAFEKARDYAREIVPAFSATAYFTFGMRLARWLSRSLYRIRLGAFDRARLDRVDPDAAVIFVMNHRSNMDYVLVTYLVSRASALSYAVGEWARIWPLSAIIRAMGAYFIRRRDRGALYRRVLARYVQMAVQGGVTQAFFPEGGLSLTGRMAAPKLGILNYIISGYAPGGRDVIFVPVAINYDRVLEDRFLIAASRSGVRRFRPPLFTVLNAIARHLWDRITFRFQKFGTASVGFGEPLALSTFLTDVGIAEAAAPPAEALAAVLMRRIAAVTPVLPVPLVARILRDGRASTESEVRACVQSDLRALAFAGAALPRRDAATVTADGIAILEGRRFILREGDRVFVNEESRHAIEYYANSIEHHFSNVGVHESAE